MILKGVGWRGSLCLAVALVLLFWASSAAQPAGSPWPMAHGNAARNGRASVNGPAIGQLFWSLPEIIGVYSSPVIGPDRTIYISSYSNNLLYAVSPEGTILWSFAPGPCGTGCFTRLGGAPAVGADGTIYLPFGVNIGPGGSGSTHGVVALSPSGIEQWRWELLGETVPDLPGAYFGSHPHDLLIGPNGTIYGSFGKIWCFEPDPLVGLCRIDMIRRGGSEVAISQDGSEVWRGKYRIPTQLALGDGKLYFGRNFQRVVYIPPPPRRPIEEEEHHLIAVDPSTGDTLWDLDLSGLGWVGDPAIGADGTIYVAVGEALYAFTPDGTVKWALDGPAAKPAIGADGTLYVAYWTPEGENFLSAIQDTGTAGSILWTIPLDGGSSSSPAIDAAGVIYVGLETEDGTGKVVAFNPDGTLKWEVELEGPPSSPLAIQEGFLYVGGSLYAIKSLPPAITLRKTAVDLNSLPLKQGDVIEYTIVITNNGGPHQDNPDHEFEDSIPANTLYIEGSASASSGVIGFESSTRRIVWNGSIASGESITLKFQVRAMRRSGVGPLSQALFWVMAAAVGLVGLRNRRALLIGILLLVSLFAFNACTVAPLHVCNQGTFHMDTDNDGIPDTNIVTDDPSTPTTGDPTCL